MNYVHHALATIGRRPDDVGVVATADIRAGEVLVVYGGFFVDRHHAIALDPEYRRFYYQVAPNIWYGPGTSASALGVGERINHACTPNAGFSGPVTLIALRDIAVGDEVTVDYAGFQSDPLDGSSFVCACHSAVCRGTVTIDDWKTVPSGTARYRAMQPYLQARLDRNGTAEARAFAVLRFPAEWQSPWSDGVLSPTLVSTAVTPAGIDSIPRALRSIAAGEVVAVAGGAVTWGSVIKDAALRFRRRQIGGGFFIGGQSGIDRDWFMSAPAASIPTMTDVRGIFIVATRDLAPGEIMSFGMRRG